MLNKTISQQSLPEKSQIIIQITRDLEFYFYSRYTNGLTDVFAQLISVNRAKEIIEENPNGQTSNNESVDWTPGKRFTWTVEIQQ